MVRGTATLEAPCLRPWHAGGLHTDSSSSVSLATTAYAAMSAASTTTSPYVLLASAISTALAHAALAGPSDGGGGRGPTIRVVGRVRCGAKVLTFILCHMLAKVTHTGR